MKRQRLRSPQGAGYHPAYTTGGFPYTKGFRFRSDVVYLKRVPGGILMIPEEERFEAMRDSLSEFTGDFMAGREQGIMENRAGLE